MKHSLDIKIVCNDQTIIDAIKAKVPAKLDSKVWSDGYDFDESVDDGNKQLRAMVRFNLDTDRQVAWTWIRDKAEQVKADLLAGSYVRLHTCYHDETPQKGCVETLIWSK